jgi:hypothetical protein
MSPSIVEVGYAFVNVSFLQPVQPGALVSHLIVKAGLKQLKTPGKPRRPKDTVLVRR